MLFPMKFFFHLIATSSHLRRQTQVIDHRDASDVLENTRIKLTMYLVNDFLES
jgi:hypothetical protein